MENMAQANSGGGSSSPGTTQKKNKQFWVYLVILLVGLGLVVAIGYGYASKQKVSVTFEEGASTAVVAPEAMSEPPVVTYTIEELDKITDSQTVLRGEYNSLAGIVERVEGQMVGIGRGNELITLTLNDSTKIFVFPVNNLPLIGVDDYGRVYGLESLEYEGGEAGLGDIKVGAKVIAFLAKDETGKLSVGSLRVYQEP